jgi:hypothetical protein
MNFYIFICYLFQQMYKHWFQSKPIGSPKECPLYWCAANTCIKMRDKTASMCSNTKYEYYVIFNLSYNVYVIIMFKFKDT